MSKTQKPLPNPPQEYSPVYMFDLASLVIDEEAVTAKINRDNVFDRGCVILKSPDGSFFKIEVANNGTLSTTAVTTVNNLPVTSTNPYV